MCIRDRLGTIFTDYFVRMRISTSTIYSYIRYIFSHSHFPRVLSSTSFLFHSRSKEKKRKGRLWWFSPGMQTGYRIAKISILVHTLCTSTRARKIEEEKKAKKWNYKHWKCLYYAEWRKKAPLVKKKTRFLSKYMLN